MKVYILVARWLGGSSVGFRVYRTMKVYILVARWLGSSSVDFRVYRTKKVYDLVARQLVSEYRAAEPLEVILVRFDYRAAEPFDANISSKVALHSEMRAIYQVNAGILAGFLKGRGDAQSASQWGMRGRRARRSKTREALENFKVWSFTCPNQILIIVYSA